MENHNRAFLYGESVFTTMRMVDGRLKDWDAHFERLRKGVEFIYGPFSDDQDWILKLRNRIELATSELEGDKVVRITVYREQARGLLRTGLISVGDLKLNISSSPLDKARFENKALKLRTCPATKRPHWWPSYLKAGNYLDTILCQKLYMRPHDDDVLFLAPDDTVLESSIANIFVVRHNKIYTAPLGPNVLDGVMRKKVLTSAGQFFQDVIESETTVEQLLKADGIFGSNSVRGLFLVDRVDDYEIIYRKDFLNLFEKLHERVLE